MSPTHPDKTVRKIIHVDMDAFFASVEQRDHPHYRNRPVVVGGNPDSRGVVAAASYEARRFGIHSAMPSAQAYRLCPDTVFVRPRFEVYRSVSEQIRAIFRQFTPLIEPLSLDEAYLDVTDSDLLQGSATRIASAIRAAIREQTGLTASAGVSYNKFLAKTASDMDKPDGLTVILPEQGPALVASLPIERFYGVGRATAERMHRLGIYTGADLRDCPLETLHKQFGKSARYYYHIARGEDFREVRTSRVRKSIGTETTFQQDLIARAGIEDALITLAEKLATLLAGRETLARTLTLKVKYADFRQCTRSQTLEQPVQMSADILPVAAALLEKTEAGIQAIRLLGLTGSSLCAHDGRQHENQLQLFFDED